MGRLARYIFVTSAVAFIAVVSTLTLMVWLTQALRRFDLLTSQGQTLLVFGSIIALTLPTFLLVTTPAALFIAVLYTLNRLNSDSELVVMSAAGVGPWQIFGPLFLLASLVAISSGAIAMHYGPLSMRSLRDQLARVNADIVTNVAIPGRFTTVQRGLTLHVRDRSAGGTLHGIFIHDARERLAQTFIAERGRIIDAPDGLFLVLEQGSLHRSGSDTVAGATARQVDNSIVQFERYAFDLSQFTKAMSKGVYRPYERSIGEILWPSADDPVYKNEPDGFRVEQHQRLAAPLYPLATFAIAFVFLGAPRTNRQSRWLAIAGATASVALLQVAAFGILGLLARSPIGVPLIYLFPLVAIALGLAAAGGRIQVRAPRFLQRFADALVKRVERLEAA
jgi:lipopolysaccharide export system permease protein